MIVTEPEATPVTTPVEASTVAVFTSEVVQVPPASPSESRSVVELMSTLLVPLIVPALGWACNDKVLLPVVLHVLSSVTVIV